MISGISEEQLNDQQTAKLNEILYLHDARQREILSIRDSHKTALANSQCLTDLYENIRVFSQKITDFILEYDASLKADLKAGLLAKIQKFRSEALQLSEQQLSIFAARNVKRPVQAPLIPRASTKISSLSPKELSQFFPAKNKTEHQLPQKKQSKQVKPFSTMGTLVSIVLKFR